AAPPPLTLPPAGPRGEGPPRPLRPPHPLPKEGRSVVPHDPRGRQRGQGGRLVLPRAFGGSRADQGSDRVLLAVDGPLVRGGRGDLRPSPRPLPPRRRAEHQPPDSHLARRRAAGRDRPRAGAV